MRAIGQAVFPVVIVGCLAFGLSRSERPGAPVPVAAPVTANHPDAETNATWGARYGAEAAPGTNTSPVKRFRELLAMVPEALEKSLAEESQARRAWLRTKLAEYEAMTPTERELRLRTTELRWHLLPLMRVPAEARKDWRAAVPAEYQGFIEARLQQWDVMPAELRRNLMENELTMSYFLRFEGADTEQQRAALGNIPPGRREKLERELAAFRALRPERREEMLGHFNRFFDLSDKEKARVLSELPALEASQLGGNLAEFDKLPPEQRLACIRSLTRFYNFTPEQQVLFMQNAELWKKMSASEQQLWRDLAAATPPLPPGFNGPPMPHDVKSPFQLVPGGVPQVTTTDRKP